jgi:hypothetical protein
MPADLVAIGHMISPNLLEALDEKFPDSLGDPKASHTDFTIRAAQRDVVNFLIRARNAADEAALLPPLASRSR